MTIPEDLLNPPSDAPDGETLRLRELHAIAELLDIPAREIDADVPPLAFHGGLGGGMLLKSGDFDKTCTITIKDSGGSS
ncbi:TPA: hypothetical protein R9B53_003856 [Escherichia coli]|nr:hypothetical protein [Escherichia coli]